MNTPSSNHLEVTIDWGLHAMLKLLGDYNDEFETVLDIGSGGGHQAKLLRYFGKQVYAVDLHHDADYVGDFITVDIDQQFDVIWCSHVIEHQRNIGLFLDKINQCLKPGGILVLTAPCHPRERIISGHITSWTPFLMCYNLILAGMDCSKASIFHDYELSIIVKKEPATGGDIGDSAAFSLVKELQPYFPLPVDDTHEWQVKLHNWVTNYRVIPPANHSVTIKSRFLNPEGLTILSE